MVRKSTGQPMPKSQNTADRKMSLSKCCCVLSPNPHHYPSKISVELLIVSYRLHLYSAGTEPGGTMRDSWILYGLLSTRLCSSLGLGLLSCWGYWDRRPCMLGFLCLCACCTWQLWQGMPFYLGWWQLTRHSRHPCTRC